MSLSDSPLISLPQPSLHLVVETALIAVVVYLLYFQQKRRRSEQPQLTEKQKDELIAEWEPEPLVPDTPPDHPALVPTYIDGKMGKYVSIDGANCLNLATTNYLGFVGDPRIEEVAKATIFKYGVGSCGPRGFYGTVDVHLDLERDLAEFLNCEEAVLYSFGFPTIASAIPAYAKRGDIIFVDKGVNFAIQKGLQASRSRIEWFEHNDVQDLERILKIQEDKDRQNPKKAATIRRFMVVEGLYVNSGDVCPLPELMALKWRYKVRIFIDESHSFGVLGATGKGVTEQFGVDLADVDMVMASLENSVASTGGFCAGRSFVVAHQRLAGLGYCFSASLPPLLTTAASEPVIRSLELLADEALRIMRLEPDRFDRLRSNARRARVLVKQAMLGTHWRLGGDDLSPMLHLYFDGDSRRLDQLVQAALEQRVVLTRARYLDKEEMFPIEPSVRLVINSELSEEEIEEAVKKLTPLFRDLN